MAAGEGYGEHPGEVLSTVDASNLPSFTISIVPIIVVVACNFVFSKFLFPKMEAGYLETVYNTSLGNVLGNWALISALIVGILVTIVLNYKRYDNVLDTLKEGVQSSFLAVMNTASEVGYGNVIKTLAGFGIVAGVMVNAFENPLIGSAISSSVLAGITGSASGGLSIALATFGDTFLDRAVAMGINPEVLHRVAAIACGGLDTLPHNGAVITLLAATGMTHKQCYLNIAMCTVVIPLISCAVIIALGTMGIC